ncbi:TolC family protein [Archangium primigenium]|uniref:TolC family protein n=1 Tax=[Archangium] primigenium TaxID=2792470 RepID=UPI00195EBE1D|nr:TolC family protein [Archangium primigenium]
MRRAGWKVGWVVCVVLGGMGTASRARAQGEGVPLSLEEVLGSTREHHPRMEAAQRDVAAAEAELLAARGGFDPLVRARGLAIPFGYYQHERIEATVEQPTPLWGLRLSAGYRLGQGDFPVYYGQYETLSAGEVHAGLALPLWRDGAIDKRRAVLAQARLRQRIAAFELAGERLGLQRQAAYHYWDWVAAGRQLTIATSQYELALARRTQLAHRVTAGDIPQIEHTENERVLLGRDADRIAARRALERATLKLSLFLRDARGEPQVVSTARLPSGFPVPAALMEEGLERWLEQALRRRPELRGLDLRREVLEVDVALARNLAAPAVDLGLRVARDVGVGPANLRPTEVQGSLVLDIPLFAREARGQRRAAEAKQAAVAARARYAREEIITEVRDALSALRASHERVGLAHGAAEVARQLARAEYTRFEHGDTSLLVVNQREQAAVEAEIGEVRALVDYQRALVDLLAATVALEPSAEELQDNGPRGP